MLALFGMYILGMCSYNGGVLGGGVSIICSNLNGYYYLNSSAPLFSCHLSRTPTCTTSISQNFPRPLVGVLCSGDESWTRESAHGIRHEPKLEGKLGV